MWVWMDGRVHVWVAHGMCLRVCMGARMCACIAYADMHTSAHPYMHACNTCMYAYPLGARRSPELSSLLHLEHAARIILPCFVTRFAAPDDAWGIAREAGEGKSSLPRRTSFLVAPGAQRQGRVQRHRRPWSSANAMLTLKDWGLHIDIAQLGDLV